MFGIDYAWGRPSMAALDRAGVGFVCRYLAGGHGGGKELTRAEAAELSAADFLIVCVWETSAQRMLSGHAAGVEDARAAFAQARACGMPDDRPIYFGCDFDATPAQQVQINAYLDGAASVAGRARIGIYGGYWPLSRAMHAGHAAWGWQTYAWSGRQWWPWAHLRQYSNDHVIDGVSVDYDQSVSADFGAWKIGPPSSGGGGTPPPSPDWIVKIMTAFPTLKNGDKGEDVRTLQALLNVRATDGDGDTDKLITVDGDFGPLTETRVREEQGDHHLTIDGIAGRQTMSVLICRKDVFA